MCATSLKRGRSLQTTSINCILYLFIVIIFCEIFFLSFCIMRATAFIILINFSGIAWFVWIIIVTVELYLMVCTLFDIFTRNKMVFKTAYTSKEKTFSTIRATTRTTSRVYETCRFFFFFFATAELGRALRCVLSERIWGAAIWWKRWLLAMKMATRGCITVIRTPHRTFHHKTLCSILSPSSSRCGVVKLTIWQWGSNCDATVPNIPTMWKGLFCYGCCCCCCALRVCLHILCYDQNYSLYRSKQ